MKVLPESLRPHELHRLSHVEVMPFDAAHNICHRNTHICSWNVLPLQTQIFCFVSEQPLQQTHELVGQRSCLSNVQTELLSHLLSHSMLLALDERLKHNADGKVEILRLDMLSQFHPGTCLRHADDALDVPG